MRSLKRALLGGGTAMLAALAFAGSAQASGVKMACLTQGTAKTTPVELVSGTGTYTFDSLLFVCAFVEKVSNAGVLQLSVQSRGVYGNIVCGTGTAKSTANVLNSVTVLASLAPTKTNWAAVTANLDYEIDFVEFSGVLVWTDSGKPAPLPKPLDGDVLAIDGNLGGVVEILPDYVIKGLPPNFPPGGTDCSKAFQVLGTLAIDEGWAV